MDWALPESNFIESDSYMLLPFRYKLLNTPINKCLLVSDAGEHFLLAEDDFRDFISKKLDVTCEPYKSLEAKNIAYTGNDPMLDLIATKVRTKKAYLRSGPSLHEIVVTLRCDHSCHYCQVTRKPLSNVDCDMSKVTADHVIRNILESPSRDITVEFQGGEPLLNFSIIEYITHKLDTKKEEWGKSISYTIVSTLHHISTDIINFFVKYDFNICTSIDGPEWLHNSNRQCAGANTYKKTVNAIYRLRYHIESRKISALTTISKQALGYTKEVVDTYIELGFDSIFLRPISEYGFASKMPSGKAYSICEYLDFYIGALNYILEINRSGKFFTEVYSSILLSSILTPYSHGYIDLRSPCGGGIGTIVYNYDGGVFTCDEARMIAEMGNSQFKMGHVSDSYNNLISSDAVYVCMNSSITECIPGCDECAYQPFCGECPVQSLVNNGTPISNRKDSVHCKKHKTLFDTLFELLYSSDDNKQILNTWALHQAEIVSAHPRC